MAQTKLHNYSVQEKLNKMDIDLIDVAVDINADAVGEIAIAVTPIPNAVAVNGGSALLQSAVLLTSVHNITDSIDIVITSDGTSIGSAADTLADVSIASTIMDGTCGSFRINNLTDYGGVSVGSKQNIGMVCKAESDTTSLNVWAIAMGTTDWSSATGVLRLGFVKD